MGLSRTVLVIVLVAVEVADEVGDVVAELVRDVVPVLDCVLVWVVLRVVVAVALPVVVPEDDTEEDALVETEDEPEEVAVELWDDVADDDRLLVAVEVCVVLGVVTLQLMKPPRKRSSNMSLKNGIATVLHLSSVWMPSRPSKSQKIPNVVLGFTL